MREWVLGKRETKGIFPPAHHPSREPVRVSCVILGTAQGLHLVQHKDCSAVNLINTGKLIRERVPASLLHLICFLVPIQKQVKVTCCTASRI